MSDVAKKMPLADAEPLAVMLRELLRPACQRVEIAGSIRRKRPEIGDIEIVCVPKRKEDLFGGEADSELDALLAAIVARRLLRPVKGGDKYKQFDVMDDDFVKTGVGYRLCALDLFITSPECWGVIYLIRTGPAEFSKRVVTQRKYGGLLPSHLRVRDGRILDDMNNRCKTEQEGDVFHLLDMGYLPPENR